MPTQILVDGPRNVVVKQIGAGTITVASLTPVPAKFRINRVSYDVGTVTDCVLSWEATANVIAITLSGRNVMDFKEFGGLQNNGGAGVTGSLIIAGTGNFTVILELVKD